MNLFTIAALLGLIFPPVIAAVQQQHWSNGTRSFVTGIMSAAGALGIVLGKGQWHGLDQATLDAFGTAFAGLYGSSLLSYLGGWKNWPVTAWVEKRTSPDPVARILRIAAKLPAADRARVLTGLNQPAA